MVKCKSTNDVSITGNPSLANRPVLSSDGVLRDIKDGTLYRKKHTIPGTNEYHPRPLTLLVSSDDGSFFNSVHFKVTHISWSLVEMPPELRQKSQNIMLSALWIIKGKPERKLDINTFWEYGFKKSYSNVLNGVAELDLNGDKTEFSVDILGFVMDKVMNRKVLNHISFNGRFGCIKCYNPGESRPTYRQVWKNGQKVQHRHGSHLMFRHRHYPPKTSFEWSVFSASAILHKKPQKGIKGPNPLTEFVKVPEQIFLDPMHLLYVGVVHALLTGVFFRKGINTSGMIEAANRRLRNVPVPSDFRRKPRDISVLAKWKATELKFFIMFYLPSLRGIIDNEHFLVLTMLSTLVTLLTKKFITQNEFAAIDLIADRTVQMIQKVFGMDFMTSNVHDLMHLGDQVRDTGPQAQVSTAVFEDLIRFLKHLVHGTTSQTNQLVDGYLENRIHGLCLKNKIASHSIIDYMKGKASKVKFTFVAGYPLHGKPRLETEPNPHIETQLLQNNFLDDNNHVLKFFQLRNGDNYIHGFEYLRKQSSCNFFVEFFVTEKDEPQRRFGDIQYFAVSPDRDRVCAVVRSYQLVANESLLHDISSDFADHHEILKELEERNLLDPFFYCIKPTLEHVLISLNQVLARAIRVPFGKFQHYYAVSILNAIECS